MVRHLLVVDDDEFFLALLRSSLETAGYQVTTADNGESAWELLSAAPQPFDLVLLDKQMPKLDGIALLKRIRASESLQDIPVILLTGDKNEDDVAAGLAAGAFYYLMKPASDVILQQVIKNTLQDAQEQLDLKHRLTEHTRGLILLTRAEFTCRTIAEAKDLALLLANASPDPDRSLNGYVELLINAIEHGNLDISYADKGRLLEENYWEQEINLRLKMPRYASRAVTVNLEKSTDSYVVTIRDQGKGFNWKPYLEFCPVRAFHLHGRGIAMSKMLHFDMLEYTGNGNTVITTVHIPATRPLATNNNDQTTTIN